MINYRTRKYFVLLLISFLLSLGIGISTIAQSAEPQSLVQQGVEQYQNGNYPQAITSWEKALQLSNKPQESIIILENLARTYQQLNQTDKAISYWKKAGDTANKSGDLVKLGRSLTEQAQVYLTLGQPRQALELLCGTKEDNICESDKALEIARQHQDLEGEVAARGSLGEAYRLAGKYDLSIETLEKALSLGVPAYQNALQQSLGAVYVSSAQLWQIRAESADLQDIPKATVFAKNALSDYQKARDYFLDNAQKSEDKATQMAALLGLIRLSYRSQDLKVISPLATENYVQQGLDLLENSPNTISTVYSAIDLATLPEFSQPLVAPLAQCVAEWQLSDTQRQKLLEKAVNLAQTLENPRSQSFALGAKGHFYECQGDTNTALKFTNQAILAANQTLAAKDSLYLWEWQKGRIFQKQGKTDLALTAYQQAFNTLESIRNDILTAERDIQLDFRQSIEPIYRELAQLSLNTADNPNLSDSEKAQELNRALGVIDALRIAELQNYLGDDCILQQSRQTNRNASQFPANTAIINSVIFENKTAIILTLPNGESKVHWIEENREDIQNSLLEFRDDLVRAFSPKPSYVYDPYLAENLYGKIMKPFEPYLEQFEIKNLVFIQDGLFRTIPMTALYDGQQFLIEKYAVSITPSLSLTSLEKGNLKKKQALILGLTEATTIDDQPFKALENVPLEIQTVSQTFSKSKSLVDSQFVPENLDKELDNSDYRIVHIASHAQFGTIPEDTFLVTGNQQKITITELEKSLRNLKDGSQSIELMSLSACQTAKGDERSALGLAGVAIQAGVKSALGSLWSVYDASTFQLITQFYDNLVQSGVEKGEALRQAQIKLIQAKKLPDIDDQYDSPYYWAPFILIGNWL